MESGITKEFTPAVADTNNVANSDSAQAFQSFIYELFEKNGILNDLRAYLRGHIVNVLKSAQTGDPPACQKHFTQRLELTYQALNILIAEYLLRLEFSYSFSVFISEIPLANMVFGFAKSLMDRTEDNKTDMRFKDCDVWSILNYLGVQCDSEHASNILEMYRNEKQHPLLLCILKCMPMYRECTGIDQEKLAVVSSEDSLSSVKSVDSVENKNTNSKNASSSENCRHHVFCKACQSKIARLKEKYKKRKKYFAKNLKECSSIHPYNMESLIKNIDTTEESLIDEMFQQLKSVYETEMEMMKVEEEKKVKRSMASHALLLQKRRDEMEENFKAREAELERNVQQKKRFLWGLAQALRDQHAHMTRAMRDVRAETQRLSNKEDSLKSQLAEAEEILKKRGEEMRTQISNELTILEGHLESMKRERDNITRERSELEQLKTLQDSSSKVLKVHNMDSDDVHSHYNLLKNELAILKKYLDSSKLAPKCVIERSTATEPVESTSNFNVALNNSQGAEKCSKSDDYDDKVKTNLLVNDFKKKNVNFSHSNLDEIYHETTRDRSRSSGSSEAGDNAAAELELTDRDRECDREIIQRLRQENDRLKAFARQQLSQIEHLSGGPLRPRTAPAAVSSQNVYNVNTSVSANTVNVGWRKGAGEELSVFSNAQPRILVPGDTLPFIGVLRDRHGTARRSPLVQGRSARARAWPLAGVSKRSTSPLRERITVAGSSGMRLGARLPIASCSLQPDDETLYQTIRERLQQRPRTAMSLEINRNREKSPKSVLREAKEKLRNKDIIKDSPPVARDKSPNSVLREAKMRLRKLEIEAEAVEKSYIDFRRRQSELRLERNTRPRTQDESHTKEGARNLDVTRSRSLEKLEKTTKNDIQSQFADIQKSMRNDFDKYLREYKAKFDIGETHFRAKPTVTEKVKPIPEAYSCINDDNVRDNYLETPLAEFRKLYSSARQTRRDENCETKSLTRSIHSDNTSINSGKNEYDYESTNGRHDALRKAKHNKKAELEILKENINKMYNLQNNNIDSEIKVDHKNDCQTHEARENMLRVEVESISEINDLKSQKQELLLVVQSSVNTGEVTLTGSEGLNEVVSTQMTIIVSPKHSDPKSTEDGATTPKSSDRPKRSLSPEQAAHLTRNDVLDAIFHADPNNHISSVQMQLELSKDGLDASISEYEKGEYPDDFSAEADNYNSRSDYENTPISQPKTSEDDNFWDS